MNRLIKILSVMLLLIPWLPLQVSAQETEQFNMPKKDGRQGDKTVSGQLMFYDMGGPTGNTVTYYAGYTRFIPSGESNQIRVTFNSVDLSGNAGLYIYDGDIDFTSYQSDIPDGYLAKLTGTSTGDVFESSTGSLSVLYHCKGSGNGAGWEALVEEFAPGPMTWISASAVPGATSAYRGETATPLIGANLKTEGSGDPFACTELQFSLEGTQALSDITKVRVLYSKGSDKAGGVQFGNEMEASNGTLTFTGNQILGGGNNYFWLVADLDNDAVAGHTLDAVLTGAVVDNASRITSQMSADGAATIENTARLASAAQTYNVGITPLTLYDDGGSEGNITQDFEGYATFVPTTPGSKLRVRFSSLDLFNTSSTGLNDVLNVYAGQTIDDASLLANVLKEPVTVSSTAPDGSLTIYLKSVAGTPKSGFTAVIEEFVPQPMVIKSVSATHTKTETVCAGDEKAEIMLIKVTTQHTEPAIEMATMTFTDSSTAPVDKALLYYLGKKTDATPALISEATPQGANITFSLSEPLQLSEQDNYFMLAYSVAASALNGQNLDASLTAVNNFEVTDGNPEGMRSIENTYQSATGTFTKTVYGDWKFVNTPSTSSYYGYDDTSGNQVTTFVPGTAGKVIELDFSLFKLMTSSYIPAPTFTVYDGKTTSSPVLWSVTSSTMTTGPENALRATNPDGALTIVFNANGGRGSSGYGFQATVTEYSSEPMRFVSATASQLSDEESVRPATQNLPILNLAVTMAGDQTPLNLNSLTLNLKDCASTVKAVKLYHIGRDPQADTGTLIAQASVAGSTVTLTPDPDFTMPEKTSYYRICFDMADSFTSDIAVDAAVSELKIGNLAVTVTDSDPDGAALTKNIYYFDGSDNVVTVSGSMLFYDNGGPEGKYTTSASGSVTFMPAAEGEIIKMTVKSFYTNYQDYLYFYDGASVAEDAPYITRLSSSVSEANLPVILSKADDGAITVKFAPKKNNINDGWEILVESIIPRPMSVTGIEVTQVNDIKVLRGSANNQILKIAVSIDGDKGSIPLSKFEFSALESTESIIEDAGLWYTGDLDAFDTNTRYGNLTHEAPFIFEDENIYDTAGTYYYWLTYNITPEAQNDSKVQAQFLSLTAGDEIVQAPDEKKVLITVQDGMHGVYSIGTDGERDFRSISEAVEAMSGGIDGPVVFELEDGNYNELVTIPEVVGCSERNNITIRSKNGNRDNVIISYNTYRDPGSSAYDKRYGVVTFDGIDFCTLENVTVTTTATTFPGLVFLRNKSEHITLRGCAVKMATSTDNAKGSYLVYQYAKNEANRNNNYMTVENCLLEGGLIGVGLTGTSYTALPKQRGGVVRNCVFRNQGSKAVYINCEEDATVCNNDIMTEGESTSSYYAFDISDAGGDLNVFGNVIRIKDSTGSSTPNPCGMYVRGYNIDKIKTGSRRIYNNEINMTACPGSSNTGIRLNTDYPGLELVNNTIFVSSSVETGNRVYGIYLAGGMKGGRIVNNIVQCGTPGYLFYSQRKPYLDQVAMSNNVWYGEGEKFAYIGADPNDSSVVGGDKNFDQLCEEAPMTDSFNEKVEFLSENVLEPALSGSLINGEPIDYVMTDLYGAERASTPTIGAYEYAESTIPPVMADDYPQIKNVEHNRADVSVRSTLTGVLHYCVKEAGDDAPDADAVKTEGSVCELRKGVEKEFAVSELQPNTTYRLYCVLSSLRGLDSSVITSEEFTTSYEPTQVADFENAQSDDARIIDGTMSFTGFSILDINDGVAPMPNTKAAVMDDEYAVIQLTNASNLEIQGFFMRNSAAVSLTAKDDALRETRTKTIEASEKWRYVDLLDMGAFTYLVLESEGDTYIDNFGARPLEMLLSIDHDEHIAVAAGEEMHLDAMAEGGVPPYSYLWTDALHNELGNTRSLSFTPATSGIYTVEVTDARGAKAVSSTHLRVLSEMVVATFDDLYLAPESHWCGETEDEDYASGSFFTGSFEFNNIYMADWDGWAAFGYSNHTSTSFNSYTTDQWNSAVGHGVDDSDNYGVVYVSNFMGKTLTTLSNTEEGQVIPGMYITNSAWVVDAVLNGDGFEPSFTEGDLYALQLTGRKADGSETVMEIPLADYRAAQERDRWYLDTWQWVDLASLGAVTELEWNVTSTKKNSFGMTTPAYICVDNIGAERPVTSAEAIILRINEEAPAATFSIEPYFSFNPEEATVVYNIECDHTGISLTDDTVTCAVEAGETFDIIAHASQRGKHEWVRIPVSMEYYNGVEAVEIDNAKLYPNPADSYVNVSTNESDYSVTVVAVDGRTVMAKESLDGKQTIDVSTLASGHYIVRFSTTDGRTAVRRLIIRH